MVTIVIVIPRPWCRRPVSPSFSEGPSACGTPPQALCEPLSALCLLKSPASRGPLCKAISLEAWELLHALLDHLWLDGRGRHGVLQLMPMAKGFMGNKKALITMCLRYVSIICYITT